MNILSIGNSFSVDCQRYLPDLFKNAGIELYAGNMYIGGCSLETHYNNMVSNEAAYDYQVNNLSMGRCRISTALKDADWDFITLQQASHFSGQADTYFPYIAELADHIALLCPKAKLIINETWAYEYNSTHHAFVNYDSSRPKMYAALTEAYEGAAKKLNLPIIPTGKAVETARALKAFDPEQGGLALTRDGFHLSYDYGRYLGAAVWFETLTGSDIRNNTFIPCDHEYAGRDTATGNKLMKELPNTRADEGLIKTLKEICHKTTQENEFRL
ncbi:MAG: DUF4886 domain-containing protein [Clostridiales bacterium]|nr:DUF4886 domain-containing protein [Clostridiales bacterium]